MISLSVSGIGAILAAVGGGVVLARCFRQPRGDLIAWAVALLGLLVSLGSQVLGHLTGFDAAMFRGMELGGQVIAPLALILGLAEVAARSAPVRFCARLYIPALAIVAVVILSLDQLAQTTFTKAWPDPAVFYQVPPDYVLMFAIGPLTTLVTLIAVGTVVARSGQPGWNAVLPAALMGGAAAVALAYPCLAQLVTYLTGIHVPVASEFAVLCAAAALLAWLAADRVARVRLSALHGSGSDATSRWGDLDGPAADDEFRQFPADSEYANGARGTYRDDGLYRREQPGSYGWQDDRQDRRDGWRSRDEAGGEHWDDYPALDATGDFAPGDFRRSVIRRSVIRRRGTSGPVISARGTSRRATSRPAISPRAIMSPATPCPEIPRPAIAILTTSPPAGGPTDGTETSALAPRTACQARRPGPPWTPELPSSSARSRSTRLSKIASRSSIG